LPLDRNVHSLNPMQPVPSPVVLLNGWQPGLSNGGCPTSSPEQTFGFLGNTLVTSGVPVVYFFDNCVEDPNGPIESLGAVLGQVLNLIQYSNGPVVPQVDLIAHSMGGLIVRAYLAGLTSNGSSWLLSPPANARVRKFVEIATPNFGSFLELPRFAGT
jgi:triacylglycerol esterase/lipase EstA (alpha/beta hydrolase family)